MESRNQDVLYEFFAYCHAHPEQRFWQALRNWSGYAFVLGIKPGLCFQHHDSVRIDNHDTFYLEGK